MAQSLLEQIKQKINIVDIIGENLNLIHKGRNYWAVCPFHGDNNPSLSVSPEKQIYHCFSCGASGDVVRFVMAYNKVPFVEALKMLANKAGIKINESQFKSTESNYTKEQLKIFDINQKANYFFTSWLNSNDILASNIQKYLQNRSINYDQQRKFELGLAPNDNQLIEFLQKQKYPPELIMASGLVIVKNNKMIDFFKQRLMIPIFTVDGKIAGFSGRLLDPKTKSIKYLNTADTAVFQKGTLLYNLNHAKSSSAVENKIIIVEGFMDVFALDRCQIENVVATMGLNLTIDHFKTLRQLTNHLVLFFDGDKPGQEASLKLALAALKQNFKVEIILNPTLNDPDEILAKEGIEKIKLLLEKPVSAVAFAINYLKHDLKSADITIVKKAINELKPFWRFIPDSLTRELYYKKLSELTKLEISILKTELPADLLKSKPYNPRQLKDFEPKSNTNVKKETQHRSYVDWVNTNLDNFEKQIICQLLCFKLAKEDFKSLMPMMENKNYFSIACALMDAPPLDQSQSNWNEINQTIKNDDLEQQLQTIYKSLNLEIVFKPDLIKQYNNLPLVKIINLVNEIENNEKEIKSLQAKSEMPTSQLKKIMQLKQKTKNLELSLTKLLPKGGWL